MRRNRTFWLVVIAVLLSSSQMIALDPTVHLSQLGHTAWRNRETVFSGAVNAIAQTPDGYLWIGTTNRLFRFDGISFVAVEQERLHEVEALKVSRDGALWVGTDCCLYKYDHDQLTLTAGFTGRVNNILEDAEETIWFSRSMVPEGETGTLCRVHSKAAQCLSIPSGVDLSDAEALATDDKGNILVASQWELIRWNPNRSEKLSHRKLHVVEHGGGIRSILSQPDGAILAGISSTGPGMGLQEIFDTAWVDPKMGDRYGHTIGATALLRDRDGALWIGTAGEGLLRYANGSLEKYSESQGLSGNSINSLFEDREGNIWIGTSRGLDRLRDLSVHAFTTTEGLADDFVSSITAAVGGGVWVGSFGSLSRIESNHASNIGRREGLPGDAVTSLLQDRYGRLWVGVDKDLYLYESGRFDRVPTEDGKSCGFVTGIAQTTDNRIWVLTLGRPHKLYSMDSEHMVLRNVDPKIPASVSLTADSSGGLFLGLEIAHSSASIARYAHGSVELISLPGHPEVRNAILQGDDIWATSPIGLLMVHGNSVRVLNRDQGLPCTKSYSVASDKQGNLWVYMECGLLMFTPLQQRQLFSGGRLGTVRIFDISDGFESFTGPTFTPNQTVSSDGKVWFANGTDVQFMEPSNVARNIVPPPVTIESLIVDHRDVGTNSNMRIGPLPRQVEVGYTALSLSAPERIRFRYQLEGHDRDWQYAGTRRRAFYNDLPPGRYRFHLAAANSDDVWSGAEASLVFTVLPAWYQTTWFIVVVVILTCCILISSYLVRIRYIRREARTRYDERLAERTRIAQDIHDTLLQTIEGSKWVADAALTKHDDPDELKAALMTLSSWLADAVSEGRAALRSLRGVAKGSSTFEESVQDALEDCALGGSLATEFILLGVPQPLQPIVHEEALRIIREAINNACNHSEGNTIHVIAEYNPQFIVIIRDDGRGINQEILRSGREGHFGIVGMNERAQRIGGKLTIRRRPEGGTDVEIAIPGNLAYLSRPGLFSRIRFRLKYGRTV